MDENQELGWLVRDTSNKIRGPFKQAEIVQLVKKGQLKNKTEISRANSYWFAIEEKNELGRFFPEFNGGKPPAEEPTQMTATLTEADIQNRVDITTFVSVPKKEEVAEEPVKMADATAPGQQIEWLSDEFAEDFGNDFGPTISMLTDASDLSAPRPAEEPHPAPEDAVKEKSPEEKNKEERARNEMLRRATVKADTLPSEHKSFQGDRPKPIDTLMRSPAKPGTSVIKESQSPTVNVPIEDGPAPKMFLEEDEHKGRERKSRRNLVIFSVVASALVVGGGIFLLVPHKGFRSGKASAPKHLRAADEAAAAARQSVLTFDLEGAKSAISDLEMEPTARSEASTYLAQAVVKKEFLFDVEGAMLALQTARQQATSPRTQAEVDNLMAVYGFDRDPASSIELLRKNAAAFKSDAVFQYNLALGYLRTNHAAEAIGMLDSLIQSSANDRELLEDASVAQGWALDSHCAAGTHDAICKQRGAEAEDSYLRALEANPASAKARLGLALFRLRREGNIKRAEGDFKAFVDLAPDLDPPSRVINFRMLGDGDFYSFAHSQIVELTTPTRPLALIMAADALVSCILNRTSDAGKILESALTSAPGDLNVLKATGYLNWKNDQLDEVVGSLKDLRDRGSFAVNLMLGKAYLKQRKRDLAEKHFRALIENFPNRSDGFSLLGDLLLEQPDRQDEARSSFQQALQKDPLDLLALRGMLRLGPNPALTTDLQKNLPF